MERTKTSRIGAVLVLAAVAALGACAPYGATYSAYGGGPVYYDSPYAYGYGPYYGGAYGYHHYGYGYGGYHGEYRHYAPLGRVEAPHIAAPVAVGGGPRFSAPVATPAPMHMGGGFNGMHPGGGFGGMHPGAMPMGFGGGHPGPHMH